MSSKKVKTKKIPQGLEKDVYKLNPLLPIKYDDNKYIDIKLSNKLISKAKLFSNVQMISHNVMIDYIIKNKIDIHSNLLYEKLYSNLQQEAMNPDSTKTVSKKFQDIYNYLKNPIIPQEIILLAFMNAERLTSKFSDSANFSENINSFTVFATRLYKIKSDCIYLKGFGKIDTEKINTNRYEKAVTVKISKSKYADGYYMELGELINIKPKIGQFDVDNIESTCIDEYGHEIFIAKPVEF